MPKLRSAKKTLRNRIKATERNRAIRSRMRTAIKRVHQASDKTTAEKVAMILPGASRMQPKN